jgi:hypothetical protein
MFFTVTTVMNMKDVMNVLTNDSDKCDECIDIGLDQAPFFSSFEHVKSLLIMGPNNTKNSSKSVIFSYSTMNNIVSSSLLLYPLSVYLSIYHALALIQRKDGSLALENIFKKFSTFIAASLYPIKIDYDQHQGWIKGKSYNLFYSCNLLCDVISFNGCLVHACFHAVYWFLSKLILLDS